MRVAKSDGFVLGLCRRFSVYCFDSSPIVFCDVRLLISSFICCRAGEMRSLYLRSSRALILSNISVGTGSILIRCRPEGMCSDAAFRMMIHMIFSKKFCSLLEAVFCSVCPLSHYDIGPSVPSLS